MDFEFSFKLPPDVHAQVGRHVIADARRSPEALGAPVRPLALPGSADATAIETPTTRKNSGLRVVLITVAWALLAGCLGAAGYFGLQWEWQRAGAPGRSTAAPRHVVPSAPVPGPDASTAALDRSAALRAPPSGGVPGPADSAAVPLAPALSEPVPGQGSPLVAPSIPAGAPGVPAVAAPIAPVAAAPAAPVSVAAIAGVPITAAPPARAVPAVTVLPAAPAAPPAVAPAAQAPADPVPGAARLTKRQRRAAVTAARAERAAAERAAAESAAAERAAVVARPAAAAATSPVIPVEGHFVTRRQSDPATPAAAGKSPSALERIF